MSKRSKNHRSKHECKPVLIQACDWCGQAFAREMDEGYFCNEVCRHQEMSRRREEVTVQLTIESVKLRVFVDDKPA